MKRLKRPLHTLDRSRSIYLSTLQIIYIPTCRYDVLRRICVLLRIQPPVKMPHRLCDYPAPTRQHELHHADQGSSYLIYLPGII